MVNFNEKLAMDHLALAKWHLDQVIEAELAARRVKHLSKLGAARYEIVETLSSISKEDAGHASQFQYSDAG
ncbi:hypothetical protein KIH86_09390 [Paenibacillus sp. HN-1]|uniref:hypothetical protein n=1 Tax=Paenibacillus TaxID=44249 RepID=UPI001CA9AAF1|nr:MULTISPECIES: hypothetical protein [Paenibacillus]MBY9077162.1 hypothetical protein [Paenibacillus sp. CGMCC 1.18879]MBY9084442.1 hypothetical protein [Paenibacillus sinensis]